MRIALLGNAGTGKSTLALKLGAELTLPVHEVDQMLWGLNWAPASDSAYDAAHTKTMDQDNWIIEGLGRRHSIEPRLSRATHIVLCDFPIWQNFWLLAERQAKWSAGDLSLTPGAQIEPPATKDLFEMVWDVETNWMPTIRQQVEHLKAEKPVTIIRSFEDLQSFQFQG